MKQNDLAKKYKFSKSYISELKHGKKHTDKMELAKELSAITGKKAIVFIHPRFRLAFSTIDPTLAEKWEYQTILSKKEVRP